MLYFDGFSGISIGNIQYMFDEINGSAQSSMTFYAPPVEVPGAMNNTFIAFNSAFGQFYARHLGFFNHRNPSGRVKWGMWIKPAATISLPWTLTTVAASLVDTTGARAVGLIVTGDLKLRLMAGGVSAFSTTTNSLIWESPAAVFTQDVWTHVCIDLDMAGMITRIFLDGVLVTTVNSTANYGSTPLVGSVIPIQLQNFGFLGCVISDPYLIDSTHPHFNEILKGKVTTYMIADIPAGDQLVDYWMPVWDFAGIPGPPPTGGVLRSFTYPGSPWGLTFPDIANEKAYVKSGAGSIPYLAGWPVCTPQGSLVAINTRWLIKASSPGEQVRGVIRDTNGNFRYSPWQSLNPANQYNRYDFAWDLDPFTGNPWKEEDFLNTGYPYSFGFEASAPIRVISGHLIRLHLGISRGPGYRASNTQVGM